ncbi:hypothetical protein [Gemmatimonas sp.]|uniref:hypothetical protein n=1 Tax=Gemmatimonas sp. TaxID=1962908 RepID=UPI0025C122A4|nr:hypothetical protein [Gemmatimonas sp.]MCA2990791.1 hypothetical protein [Gemmatimonas sp.]
MPALTISPRTEFYSTHKTGKLAPTMAERDITAALAIFPTRHDRASGDGKVTMEWSFYVTDGEGKRYPCGVWDYKGARWSVYGPPALMADVFGEAYREGY